MIQLVVALLLASFFMGLIGYGIQGELEEILTSLLTSDVALNSFHSSWKILAGFIILFVIPVSGLTFLGYLYYSDNPDKRFRLLEGLKKTVISIILVSISFFLYSQIVSFFQSFTELGLMLSSNNSGFKTELSSTSFLVKDIKATKLLNGELARNVILNIYKSGGYTISLVFLVTTLGLQRALTRFGVILMPLAIFMYNLPFDIFESYGLSILKGLILVLSLPFLDALLLSIVTSLPTGTHAEEITYITGFAAIAMINWSILKKVILNPFKNTNYTAKFVNKTLSHFERENETKSNIRYNKSKTQKIPRKNQEREYYNGL